MKKSLKEITIANAPKLQVALTSFLINSNVHISQIDVNRIIWDSDYIECKKERKRSEERWRGGGDKEQEGLRYFMILDVR